MSDFNFKQVNRLKQKHLCCPRKVLGLADLGGRIANSPTLQYRFPCKIKLAIKINSSVGSNNHNECYTVADQPLNAYGKWAGCPGGSGPGYSSTMRYVPNENVPGLGPTIGGSICNCNYAYGTPYNLEQPVISGNTFVTSILTVSNGSWSSFTTISYSYQWYRGNTMLNGQTSNTYTIVSTDVGQSITCSVIGTNISGSSIAVSNSIIATSLPSNTVAPTILGSTPVGSTLNLTSTGTWTGYPYPTFTYQWFRGITSLTGQTSTTYVTQTADFAQPVKCRVTGTNTSGSSSADSGPITPTSGPPVNTVLPVVSGNTPVGSTLTVTNNGTWNGYPAPTFTYQWLRNNVIISGATSISYVTQTTPTTDVGQTITCRVTGTNFSGSSVNSNSIIPIQPPPSVTLINTNNYGQLNVNNTYYLAQGNTPYVMPTGSYMTSFTIYVGGTNIIMNFQNSSGTILYTWTDNQTRVASVTTTINLPLGVNISGCNKFTFANLNETRSLYAGSGIINLGIIIYGYII